MMIGKFPLLHLGFLAISFLLTPVSYAETDSFPDADNRLSEEMLSCLRGEECSEFPLGFLSLLPPDSTNGKALTPRFSKPEVLGKLWQTYPNGTADEVKKMIGGNVDKDYLVNTCVIRVSHAMNYSGVPHFEINPSVPGVEFVSGAAVPKKYYAFRVQEFSKYLLNQYGPAFIHAKTTSSSPGKLRDAVAGKRGLILFVVQFSDATGHFDLWDGTAAKHEDYFDRATEVFLWE